MPFWIEGGPGERGDLPRGGEKYAAFIEKPVSQLIAWCLAKTCSCATAEFEVKRDSHNELGKGGGLQFSRRSCALCF